MLLQVGFTMRATAQVSEKGKVLVLSGPTAVGKSSVAIELAKRLGGEIISADSVQLYRGLDVGSAKTPVKDRQNIPHHLIDIVDPTEEYSAGEFFRDARNATEAILAKGRVPIVVGGTGLYLRWYLNGKPDAPKSTKEDTEAAESEISQYLGSDGGWDAALKHLADSGDPETPKKLATNDWYRLRRALEILRIAGRPRTCFPLIKRTQKQPSRTAVEGDASVTGETQQEFDYNFLCYFLHTPRTELYERIDHRCEEMLADAKGLLGEASWLLDLGVQPNTSSPSRAIGYRQAMEYLHECRSTGGATSAEGFLSFLARFQKASRNYAKRQYTWFRGDSLFRWVDASQPVDNVVQILENEYLMVAEIAPPSAWEIAVKAASVSESKLLKYYKTKNRLFTTQDAYANVLDWVAKTQVQNQSPG